MKRAVTVLLFLLVIPQALALVPGAEEAAAQVQVTNITTDPAILMPYDTATVTLTIVNTGTESVALSHAELLDKDIRILSDNYGKVGAIGGGNTMRFTFTIQAGARTGIFYPVFSLDFRDANFLRHPVKVVVQDNRVEVSVLKKPEIFSIGKKDEITLHIGNPRENMVTGVVVVPNSTHEITPTSFFAGMLSPDSSLDIPFSITPDSAEPVTFTVHYNNGINEHQTQYILPMNTGTNKKQANPILSNVIIENKKDYWQVTGDVTNSGLETANAVEITSGDPAKPVFPFKINAIGALKPDDFSSFELTFKTDSNVTEVPLIANFKDDDGNSFSSRTMIETATNPLNKTSTDEGMSGWFIPAVVILVVVLVSGVILYTRRR